ncbi:DUF4179 domain-containing protein [Rossellomorea vietnamensis]|uniref:DUF4179 domain-containing protein n=1 Tax=Rossellomorea vietnamensis TaxID=218284 RepID=A0A5D4MFM6_9BACI|nr:DUF4179 domain-containing protein [Rossellomorea vietnamensis]TYS00249.1 DUF4179 domain-containing protein [Rossellomorea vietnamensis]
MKAEKETLEVKNVSEEGMKTVLGWFDSRKASFYKLARAYSNSNNEIQEIFYQTIMKIYDERKYNIENRNFKFLAASIFMNECQEVKKTRADETDILLSGGTFNKLKELDEKDKEAIAITYLKEFSFEEAARILQITVESLKSRLYRGIQQLSNRLDEKNHPESCTPYRNKFVDYLGKDLVRTEKIELEVHIPTCHFCQEELADFQDTILSLQRSADQLHIPPELMRPVKEKAVETERIRTQKKKKRNRFGLAAAGMLTFIICTGFVTGGFTSLYYSWMGWTEKEEMEIIQYYKSGIGEPLELVQESNGVKVTVKTAVADDVQTMIYYEVEDMNKENQYFLNQDEGMRVENEYEILDRQADQRFYHPFEYGRADEEEENIFRGKISLAPINSDSGTIQLRLMRLQETIKEEPGSSKVSSYHPEFLEGDWSFDIPVEKYESTVFDLDQESDIDGIPIKINKLTLAPTATLLQYSYQERGQKQWIEHVTMDSLSTDGHSAKADYFGGGEFITHSGEWTTFQSRFEPLFNKNPEEVTLSIGSMHLFIEDKKEIEVNQAGELPQSFDYRGNELTIDGVETEGNTTKVYITDPYFEGREHERLRIQVMSDSSYRGYGFGVDGILIDKNGEEFDPEEYHYPFDEEIEQPRFFETSHEMEIYDDASDDPGYPAKLMIEGYNFTKYIENKISIPLN